MRMMQGARARWFLHAIPRDKGRQPPPRRGGDKPCSLRTMVRVDARARTVLFSFMRVSKGASNPIPGCLATSAAAHLCTMQRERGVCVCVVAIFSREKGVLR